MIELAVDPAEIAAALPPGRRALLEGFDRLLKSDAAARGYIARATAAESWMLHVLDSLAGVALLESVLASPTASRIVDVGSGAGLPGIPLAIARRGWQLTLLDSHRGRVELLQQFVHNLEIGNAEPLKGDVATAAGGFDAALARALAPPETALALCRRLVAGPGPVILYLTGAQLDNLGAKGLPDPLGVARYRLSGLRSGRVVAAFAAQLRPAPPPP